MTDQQRGSTVHPGNPAVTPEIDRFRRESVTFTSATTVSPHCCPSRASFFTGLYPSRHGVWNNVCVQTALSTGLNPGVRCWSETLAETGYQLDWNGKWHVSWDEGPDARGFQVHTATAVARHQGQGVMGFTWENYVTGAGHSADTPRQPGEIKRPGYGDYFCTVPDRTGAATTFRWIPPWRSFGTGPEKAPGVITSEPSARMIPTGRRSVFSNSTGTSKFRCRRTSMTP